MKICILINSLRSGGSERQAVNIAKMLKQNGNDVSIVTYFGDNFFEKDLDESGIHYCMLNCNKPIKAIAATRKHLKCMSYDVVIAFLRSPILCACVASIVGKKWKLIARLGSANKTFFSSNMWKLMRSLINVADVVVCNSWRERDMWRTYSKLDDSKLKVIYNIYPDLLSSSKRKNLPHKFNKTIIVVPASYSRIKNIQNVIHAISMLDDDERKQIEIHWYGHKEIAIGDTEEYSHAIMNVDKLGLEKTIYLHDETKDIYNKMCEADYVGLFSFFEGLPNAICEAMLLGLPIIMTEVSDYNILIDGNGYTCSQNAESIRDVFKLAIRTSELQRMKMGIQSFEKAKKLFSLEVLQKKWYDVLIK